MWAFFLKTGFHSIFGNTPPLTKNQKIDKNIFLGKPNIKYIICINYDFYHIFGNYT